MTTISTAKKSINLEALVDQIARIHIPVKIRTPKSTCILISDDEWRSIQETLYLKSIPGVWESIVEGMKAPLEDFVSADEIEWLNEKK